MAGPLRECDVLYFFLSDLNQLLRDRLVHLKQPVVILLISRDFMTNTLDRFRTSPQPFLKVQHTVASQNPLSLATWEDFLEKLIADTWDVRCEAMRNG